jgi:23S rRNA pseudouridine2605 synthase
MKRKDAGNKPEKKSERSPRPRKATNTDSSTDRSRTGDNVRADGRRVFRDSGPERRSFGDRTSDDRGRKPFDGAKPSFDKRPFEKRNDKRSFGGDKDDRRSFGGEKRSFGGDRDDKRSFGGENRSFGGDRDDKRSFGGEKRSFGGDRDDKRSFGGEKRSFGGEKRSFGGDRDDKRSFGGENRSFGGDRDVRRSFGGEKRSFGADRDDRRSFGGEKRSFGGDREDKRSFGGDREDKRSFAGDRDDRRSFDGEKRSFGGDRDDRRLFGGEKRSFGGDRDDRRSFGGEKRSFGGDRDDRRSFGGEKRSFGEDRRPSRGSDAYEDRPGKRSFGRKKGDTFEYGQNLKPQKRPDYSEENLFKAIPERQKKKIEVKKPVDVIRLNRYIANSGICSRREADDLIESGQITVNGKAITEMGYQVKMTDVVKYGRKILNPEKLVYVLLNKPKDFITTTDDPEGRRTVMELVAKAGHERIYPVGRLDRATTGLLLFTNDGELAEKLSHPSNEIRKIYQVEIDKPLAKEDFEKLLEGVELEDGFIKPDQVSIVTPDQQVIGIEIHSGKNRVVRRIFEHLGYDVTQLDRTTYAGLTKKDLPRGNWRFLTEKEVIRLKYMI